MGEGGVVNLCSYDAAKGNYPTITDQILKDMKITDSVTYKFNEKYSHPYIDSTTTFSRMASSSSFALQKAVSKSKRLTLSSPKS